MDPLTQGLLGATCAQGFLPAQAARRAWLAGLAGGLLPDADVLLEPLADPALPWELHRQFTHAFVMGPVMGLLAGSLLLLLIPWFRKERRLTLLAATLGAISHAPLDWMTSYGTQVLWPFSHHGYTTDLYPIVDPLFTFVLLVCVLWGAIKKTRRPIAVAAIFLVAYTSLAWVQQSRAEDAQARIQQAREHKVLRSRVMPLPGSLFVWRSLYETEDGRMVADVIRVGPFQRPRFIGGSSLERITPLDIARGVEDRQRVLDLLPRFEAFAHGWIGWTPDRENPRQVGDMRFAQGAAFEALWGIEIRPEGNPTLRWSMRGFDERGIGALWDLILGRSEGMAAVPGE